MQSFLKTMCKTNIETLYWKQKNFKYKNTMSKCFKLRQFQLLSSKIEILLKKTVFAQRCPIEYQTDYLTTAML